PPSSTLFPSTTLFRSPSRLASGWLWRSLCHRGGQWARLDRSPVGRNQAAREAGGGSLENRRAALERGRRRQSAPANRSTALGVRSEEHTSELQSLAYL